VFRNSSRGAKAITFPRPSMAIRFDTVKALTMSWVTTTLVILSVPWMPEQYALTAAGGAEDRGGLAAVEL
jgi:hypothetical protein